MRFIGLKTGLVAAVAFVSLAGASAKAQDDEDMHMRHHMMRSEMHHEMMRHEMRREMHHRHMMHRMMRHEMQHDD